MTRQVTWRCERCDGKLSGSGLYNIAELDRIHAETCPGVPAKATPGVPAQKTIIEDVDVFEGWL